MKPNRTVGRGRYRSRTPSFHDRSLAFRDIRITDLGNLRTLKSTIRKGNMGNRDRKQFRPLDGRFDRFYVRKQIAVPNNVPDGFAAPLIDIEDPYKCKACLQLKEEEVAGFETLLHSIENNKTMTDEEMLAVAIEEARLGLSEGGIPIGAALFSADGKLLGRGHNRRVQEDDPSIHGETDAFRRAGRQQTYRDKIMVTTLSPCWYCSGLIRQFNIGKVIIGETVNFRGGIDWLSENDIEVVDLNSRECIEMLTAYIEANSEVWNEDIGVG